VKTCLQIVGRTVLGAGWAPITVLVLHSVLGRAFGHEPFVDPVIHFSGGVAAAFFFRYACGVAGNLLGAPNDLAKDLVAFGLAVTVALLWETGEFASDVWLGTHIQHDVANTMRDLILGMGGAASYVLAARVARSGRRRTDA
jgi:hypothetical protein